MVLWVKGLACPLSLNDLIFNNITSLEMSAADQDAAAQMSADQDMGKGFPRSSVAPGDETFTLPHKGGEHEAFEDPAQQVADVHGVYVDTMTFVVKFNDFSQSPTA